jgi:hypothetical protein
MNPWMSWIIPVGIPVGIFIIFVIGALRELYKSGSN